MSSDTLKKDISVIRDRSLSEIQEYLSELDAYQFHEDCFENYWELCKKAYSGIVMPVFSFYPMTNTSDQYGILRARKFQGDLPSDVNFFWEPPKDIVTSLGRCNLKGESVFYGANHIATALIETRAKVGELWFVANFNVKPHLSVRCFALGHSDQTFMEQAKSFKEDFYKGWDAQDEMKNRLVDDYIHRCFRKDFVAGSLDYFQTVGISKYFLGCDQAKGVIEGIVYPSVASGIRGGNFMILAEAARRILTLSQVRLFRLNSIDSAKISALELAVASIDKKGHLIWDYRKESFQFLNFKKVVF